MKINPFTPNSPKGVFVGRLHEIHVIEKILLQTRANKGHGFLLLGQRGIGKTSLLNLIKYEAEGSIKIKDESLNFLVIDIDISKETTQYSLSKGVKINSASYGNIL